MSLTERNGFFWIRFKSPQGHVFEPLVAWRQAGSWRVPGSAEAVPDNVTVEVLEGPLVAPSIPAAP